MAGVHVTIDDKALHEITAKLNQLANASQDLSIPMAQVGEYLLRSTRQRFRDQQAPDGKDWHELSDVTKQRKKRNASRILTMRGYLQGRLVMQSDSNSAEVGSNQVYAAAHQFGMRKGYAGTTANRVPAPDSLAPPRQLIGAGAQKQQDARVSGELKITIDSEGRPKVAHLDKTGDFDLNAIVGRNLVGVM